jgi:hypothetical protein
MAIQNTNQDHPVVAATRARQGRWGKHVLWVLIVSTVLAALVLMATWGANSNKLASVQDNVRANTPAEAVAGDTAQGPIKQN